MTVSGTPGVAVTDRAEGDARPAIMRAEGLTVHYKVRGSGLGASKHVVYAVDDLDLEVLHGETLGLVGESGCGKTTTGRAMVGRVPLTRGKLFAEGRDVTHLSKRGWRRLRRDIQLIFQDPYASLNPRMRVRDIVAEPLVVNRIARGAELDRRVAELLDLVRLPASAAQRYPHAFSGGQRQRIVIARALALHPRFVVADEPVSALDVSIQAQIVGLLQDLQQELGLSYLFIAHNLAVVRHIADRVAVMYLGHLVEVADKGTLYENALHPYTRALLSAVPIPDPTVERPGRIILTGDVPSPMAPPLGCRFNTRCPFAVEQCFRESPPLTEVEPGHRVACWVAVAEPNRIKEAQHDHRARPALH
jgi:oligopeptide/dipeptide ABC transporter ATP-binding protein